MAWETGPEMTTLSYIPPEMTTLAAVRSGLSLLLSSWPTHSDMVLAGSMEGTLGRKKQQMHVSRMHVYTQTETLTVQKATQRRQPHS